MIQEYYDYIEDDRNLLADIVTFPILKISEIESDYVDAAKTERKVGGIVSAWNFESNYELKHMTIDEFDYIEQRFKSTQSKLGKILYGEVLYHGAMSPYSKRNDFKEELADNLHELSFLCWHKLMEDSEGKQHYIQKYIPYVKEALAIYKKIKNQAKQENIRDEVICNLLHWDTKRKDTLRGIVDLTDILSENKQLFKDYVTVSDVIDNNIAAFETLEKSSVW